VIREIKIKRENQATGRAIARFWRFFDNHHGYHVAIIITVVVIILALS